MRKTVNAAKAMKVRTALKERGESRANPQTPWPEVQPEPMVVPIPTSNPAIAMPMRLVGTVCSIFPPDASKISGAAKRPATKQIRQIRSATRGREGMNVDIAPLDMPIMPAIRPKKSMTITADNPIRTPPVSEANGVKDVSVTGCILEIAVVILEKLFILE